VTGPQEPDSPDSGTPEVGPVGPASTQLPEPEAPAHDTGSDAWWRAQREAQRAAAAAEPPLPTDAVPTDAAVPNDAAPAPAEPNSAREPTTPAAYAPGPTPLDEAWLPPGLATAEPASAPPEPAAAPARVPLPLRMPAPADVTDPSGLPPVEATPAWAAAESGLPAVEESPVRAPAPAERVGPARAVTGVALGIGALLLFGGNDEPKGSPTVALPPVTTATATATAAPVTTAPSPAAATRAPVTGPTPAVPGPAAQATVVPVSVLNNSRIKGLASRAAARFRAAGWPVAGEGNYSGGVISTTTVYYAPGQQASAERFAREFGIARVAPRFAGLPTRGMTVVLTRDYRG
jgi:hypothetical protein